MNNLHLLTLVILKIRDFPIISIYLELDKISNFVKGQNWLNIFLLKIHAVFAFNIEIGKKDSIFSLLNLLMNWMRFKKKEILF